MLATTQYAIRSTFEEQGILFCYSGYMTEAILLGIGQAIRQKLAVEDTDARTTRTVFAVFVEQMQNVIRYSAEQEQSGEATGDGALSFGLLVVGREDGHHFITCSNKVKAQDVERLRGQLEAIRSMDKQELKAAYKQILRGETPAGSKGAGVGFIDIARQASKPIEFDFMALNADQAFFSLKACI